MKKHWKQYKVENGDDSGVQYKSFDEVDIYFDSSISPKILNFIRNMQKGEHITLEFVDGSSSKVTKMKDGYPRWTVA